MLLIFHLYSNLLYLPHNHTHNLQSDEELLNTYKISGDSRCAGLLLQRYTLLLLGVGMKYLKDKAQAQDAVQQVFLKALTHMLHEDIRNFKGWLYILMRNHCFQLLRDSSKWVDDSALAYVPQQDGESKEELMWQEYTLEQLSVALQELNTEQKITIELFYLHKQSYKQITDATGYSFEQVKSYIQNGKRNLKTILIKKLTANRS